MIPFAAIEYNFSKFLCSNWSLAYELPNQPGVAEFSFTNFQASDIFHHLMQLELQVDNLLADLNFE